MSEPAVPHLMEELQDLFRHASSYNIRRLCGQAHERIAALEAENKDLHERLAFAESREVCGAAHDHVETCGFCQRDARDARIYALAAELAGTKDELYSVDKAAKELGERAAQLEGALIELAAELAEANEEIEARFKLLAHYRARLAALEGANGLCDPMKATLAPSAAIGSVTDSIDVEPKIEGEPGFSATPVHSAEEDFQHWLTITGRSLGPLEAIPALREAYYAGKDVPPP